MLLGDTQDVPLSTGRDTGQSLEQWESQGQCFIPCFVPSWEFASCLRFGGSPGIPFSSTAWCCCDQWLIKSFIFIFLIFSTPKFSSCVEVACGEVQVPQSLWGQGHPCPIPNPPRAASHLDFRLLPLSPAWV